MSKLYHILPLLSIVYLKNGSTFRDEKCYFWGCSFKKSKKKGAAELTLAPCDVFPRVGIMEAYIKPFSSTNVLTAGKPSPMQTIAMAIESP
jgi:hypothetical protein